MLGCPSTASAQLSVFGSGADLTLKIGALERGAKSSVTVNILARNAISPRRVYVELRCNESVEIDDYNVQPETGKSDQKARKIKVRKTDTVGKLEITLAENQQYLANTQHQVGGEIDIPVNFPRTGQGNMFRVRCEARSGLDIFGNDPNSAWQDVKVE